MTTKYEGILGTLFSQYTEDEIRALDQGEKIFTLKKKVDRLLSSKSRYEVQNYCSVFTHEEINYLNSPLLDQLIFIMDSKSPSLRAAETNSLEALKFYENIPDYSQFVEKCVENDSIDVLRYLVEEKNAKIGLLNTCVAIGRDSYRVLKYIIEKKLVDLRVIDSVFFKNYSYNKSLIYALENGAPMNILFAYCHNIDVVRAVMEDEKIIGKKFDISYAVRISIVRDHFKVVKYLLEYNKRFNIIDNSLLMGFAFYTAFPNVCIETLKYISESGLPCSHEEILRAVNAHSHPRDGSCLKEYTIKVFLNSGLPNPYEESD